MTRGLIYKAVFIIAIIIFAIILVLPTVGTKRMEVYLNSDITPEEAGVITARFSSDDYQVIKEEGKYIIEATGATSINDAVMNEVRTFNGVKDAKILQHWAEKMFLAKKINFGLDLQGGMHLVMMANFEKIQKQVLEEKERLTKRKEELKSDQDTKKLSKEDAEKEIDEIDAFLKDIDNNKLTDAGELREKYRNEITQQALEMLRNRIDKFGVSEPTILQRGNDAIEIQLPGVKDPKSVKRAIGTTGSVQYRLVDDEYTKNATNWVLKNYKKERLPESLEEQEAFLDEVSKGIKLPDNLGLLYLFSRDANTKKIYPSEVMALQRKVAVAGSDISKAWIDRDEYGALNVHFRTTPEGAAKFAKVTAEENRGKRLAIIIDEKIRSAPRINDQISTGDASITGDFTMEEVNALARIIQEGALPVDLTIAQESTVGASLGQDSIESAIKAIVVGLIGLLIFMVIYYKLAGLISIMGLVLNTVFIFALLSWLGFTLTLPGLMGIILTIGMAVDANVIIYERIKEELKSEKSVRMSITNGFGRAFWAIFDANLTTLIAMFVLSQYGTGFIKGFAVTLSVGIICSMFVALYVTKFIYELISLNKNLKKLSI